MTRRRLWFTVAVVMLAGLVISATALWFALPTLARRVVVWQVEAQTGFGQAFGMVFQIRDDVLDVVATDAELGKPAGQDLVEGIYTLPVIRALADPGVGDPLRDLLGRHLGPDERDRARDLVRTTGAVAAALGEARRFADQAAASLEPLDPSPVVEGMAALAHQLLDPLTARVA